MITDCLERWQELERSQPRRPPGLTGDALVEHLRLNPEDVSDPWYVEKLSDPTWPVYAPANVLCITDENVDEAVRIKSLLRKQLRHVIFACDTEVSHIDLAKESPVGHGRVTCFSLYGGPDVNFAQPGSDVHQDTLWVETSGKAGRRILSHFREFFEDPDIKKIWHNYGFDRHVLDNELVDVHPAVPGDHGHDSHQIGTTATTTIRPLRVQGFAVDTLHMARLLDTSRQKYALDELTSDPHLMPPSFRPKEGMKSIFSRPKFKKDGEPGKARWLPPVEELQRHPLTRGRWIEYSAYDAAATWMLWHQLRGQLSDQVAHHDIDPALRDTLYAHIEVGSRLPSPVGWSGTEVL